MVSAQPTIGFWCDFHSQFTKKPTLEPILPLRSPKSRKSHKNDAKVDPRRDPKSIKNPLKSNSDPQVSHEVSPGIPQSPKCCPKVPKWSLQTFQILDLGTQNRIPANHQFTGRQGGRRQGRSLNIRRTPAGGAGRDGILAPFCRICMARQAFPLPPAPPN